MIEENIVCVIPARGGSKGIPRKNLVDLGGKPLLKWTIEAALESKVLSRVIVSTDDKDIASFAREAGASAPFIRPNEIATDDIHSVHVVLHVLDWLNDTEDFAPDGIMMLLPTSPFRSFEHIRGATNLFLSGSDSVISVVDLGKYMTNFRYMDNDVLEMVAPDEEKNAQRQGLKKLYSVNGSIYIAKPNILRLNETFHIDGAKGYLMDSVSSVDINSLEDLRIARLLAKSFV